MNIAYNMDCVKGMKTLSDESIDLTVTSPPYDNLRDYKGFSFDWKATISELARITKLGGGSRLDRKRRDDRRFGNRNVFQASALCYGLWIQSA